MKGVDKPSLEQCAVIIYTTLASFWFLTALKKTYLDLELKLGHNFFFPPMKTASWFCWEKKGLRAALKRDHNDVRSRCASGRMMI